MEFLKAVELINKNQHLIGKKIEGAIIDELIVCPTDSNMFNDFSRQYLFVSNAQQAVAPYVNEDVTVYAILDKHRIKTQSIFIYKKLIDLTNDLEVILD